MGSGTSSSMQATFKFNRGQSARRKQRVKNVRDYFRDVVVKRKQFTGKEVPKDELERIKARIRAEAKRRNTLFFVVKLSLILLFTSLFVLLLTVII